jgi:hypothetical protein
MAYLEYSADPDNWDPYDEASWWEFMPALGHTIGTAAVRHALSSMTSDPRQGLDEFRRAYGNIPTVNFETLIPPAKWEAVCSDDVVPLGGLVFGVAVSADRGWSAVAAGDASGRVELVEHRPGVSWVSGRVAELVARHSGTVARDGLGPASTLPLDGARDLDGPDMAAACSQLFDEVVDAALPSIRVRHHPALSAAVAGVARQPRGERWVWSRRGAEDVTPLEAVTVAWWAASRGGGASGGGFAWVMGD